MVFRVQGSGFRVQGLFREALLSEPVPACAMV
jgi:hypothetical protein